MSIGEAGNGPGMDFETAQADGSSAPDALRCTGCQSEIASQYFTAGEAIFCDACRLQFEAELRNQSGLGLFARAGFFGFLAALAGAALWGGVIWLTGYELGLIAVVVGFMVGAAVKLGTRGRGGALYQLMAVAFTYLAVSLAYVPLVVQGFQQLANEELAALEPGAEDDAGALPPLVEDLESLEAASAEDALGDLEAGLAAEPAAFGSEALAPDAAEPVVEVGWAGLLIGAIGVLAIAAALPFLSGFENIIGIAIIAFALWQAWSMNKKVDLSVSGPYRVGDGG